ncbi:MAG: cation diffusion facilitator family transporter [Candidatus Omnitrophica bacterium]|nr:cation diffusion facilitator family transporter [Candidatus Omnitrophota bacterium]
MHSDYHSQSLKISFLSIAVNAFLIAVKLTIGLASNSMAVIADAFHSFSDVTTTIVVIISVIMSRKPADSRHPFGHGRIEDIGGLFMSILLGGAGIKLFFDSWQRMFTPQSITMSWGFILLIFFTALVKLWLGFITQRTAGKIKSDILKVDAFHHHADFITSILVVLGLVLVERGFIYVDGILGMSVSGLIIIWAMGSLKGFIDNLIGKDAPREVYARIKEIVLSFPQVEGVHDITVHAYGKNFIISLHVEVPRSLSLEEAHSVADAIEHSIEAEELGRCIVHIDVGTPARPDKTIQVDGIIRQFVQKNPLIKGFHKVEVITIQSEKILSFHLLVDADTSLGETHRLTHKAERFLKSKMSFSRINIHVEPYRRRE